MRSESSLRFSEICLTVCLLVLLSAHRASGTYHSTYVLGWRPTHDAPRECSSYRERAVFRSCPRATCVDGYYRSQCCVKINRGYSGRILSRECICDPAVRCTWHSAPAPPPIPQPPPQPIMLPPQLPPSDRSVQGNQRSCTRQFELDFYKPCHTDFCTNPNLNNAYVCCMRSESVSAPETCLCHPESSCAVGDFQDSEDECEDGTVPDEFGECLDENIEDKSEDTSEEDPEEDPEDDSENETEEDEAEEEPAPVSLCADRVRLLNADKVNDPCKYMGVAKLTRRGEDGDQLVCNAVYTIAQIDGVVQRTFLTPQACGGLLEDENLALEMELQVGDQKYPVQEPIFSTSSGPNGNWFIRIAPRYANLFRDLGSCQENACPYDPGAMRGKVDFNDCKAVSWGASDAATFSTDGLYEVSIAFYPGGCLDQEDFFDAANTLCFRTTDEENAYCANDAGAPVYCRSPSTEEWILMGIVAFQNKCDTQADLKVIPFPL